MCLADGPGRPAVKEMYLPGAPGDARRTRRRGSLRRASQQAQNNLTYHMDAIKRSDMLKAWHGLHEPGPAAAWADTYYSFANRSRARQAYGIMAQIDGDSLTAASA
jgi:hypothetical protein